MKDDTLKAVGYLVAGLAIFFIGIFVGVSSVEERARAEATKEIQHIGVVDECIRVNLISCIACHDFPAFAIDVEPEIWEE